jgi:hypothetical protein
MQADPATALAVAAGTPGTMNTGQAIQPGMVAGVGTPNAGAFTPSGAPVQVYPSRSALAGQTTQIDNNPNSPTYGQPIAVPLANRLNAQGAGGLAGPAGVAGTSAPPSPSSPPRLPPAGGAGTSGGVAVGLPPGRETAANAAAAANTQQAIALQNAAASVPAQKGLLGNLEAQLQQVTTGPGADWRNFAKSFVNANNPFGENVFNPATIASQEEFTKQAFQLAQQQFQTLGGTGTDAKLDSTMHTSPSTMLTNLGNHGIISLLKGNADAIAAMNRAWQTQWLPQHGNDTGTYGQFVTQFNQSFDPRIFQSAYMTPTQRAQLLQGMTPAEQTAFRMKYNNAVQSGWIPDPRNPQPQQ